MQNVDLIITPDWVIPMDPVGKVYQNHSVAVANGAIVGIQKSDKINNSYKAKEYLSLDNHVLLPGFVNLHTHAAMSIFRGIADDKPLMEWLNDYIWPLEASHVSKEFVHDGTALACTEMIKGGITCFNDMYFFPEDAAAAALEIGMRAVLGIVVIEFPTKFASDAEDYIRKGLLSRDNLIDESLIHWCLAPHSPYTVSNKSMENILTLSNHLNLPIHIHFHETKNEIEESLREHGVRPLQRLHKLGLLSPSLIAVHCVHLNPTETLILANEGCSVAHCPSSNLKLASGLPDTQSMIEQGINLGLGTDSAASNNRLDMFSEMRLASLLAKGVSGNAQAIAAHEALAMATIQGAQALGLENKIGSLKKGKLADMIAIDLSPTELQPVYDPASHIINCCGREHVTNVWVNGKQVVKEKRVLSVDETKITDRVKKWKTKINH